MRAVTRRLWQHVACCHFGHSRRLYSKTTIFLIPDGAQRYTTVISYNTLYIVVVVVGKWSMVCACKPVSDCIFISTLRTFLHQFPCAVVDCSRILHAQNKKTFRRCCVIHLFVCTTQRPHKHSRANNNIENIIYLSRSHCLWLIP